MKKLYVLAAATMLCATAGAANAPQKKSNAAKPARVENATALANTYEAVAYERDHSQPAVAGPKKAAPVYGEAYYKRPAGSMFGALTSEGYAYYNPYVTVKPFADATFEAIYDLNAYNWAVQLYDSQAQGRVWYDVAGSKAVKVTYGYETDTVPSLTDGVTEFHVGGDNGAGEYGWSRVAGIPDMTDFTYDPQAGSVLLSPKYFGKRWGAKYYTTRYSGAKDAEGGTSGMWFGKNYSGWNAMGLYVEKPENPYLLRSVAIDYGYLDINADATLYVDVFEVANRVEDDSLGMDITLGEKIASGHYTFYKADEPADDGVVYIPFVVDDEGIEYEISLDIDYDYVVVVSGYDAPEFTNFSMSISYDIENDGYGQHGYMMHKEEDSYTRCIGLDHFFVSSLGYVAPSVFLDVVNSYATPNYISDDAVREFDKEGACTTPQFDVEVPANDIQIYSYNMAEDYTITLEDGSDLPEWINIEVADAEEEETGEWTGVVVATVTCQPNAGAPREAKVKFAIPGAKLIATIKQDGEAAPVVKGDVNGDGLVDIADVNACINVILGSASLEDFPAADVNGDGSVDIADVNEIINIILGA
mgnify:FL=1